MALHFNGKREDGTHVISGSSDEVIPGITAKERYGVGITSSTGVAKWSEKIPLSCDYTMAMNGYIGRAQFALEGKVLDTDLSTVAVYRNGVALHESQYKIDADRNILTLSNPITSTDDSIEVRSNSERREGIIVDNVLLLKADEHITRRNMHKFMPNFAEVISLDHLARYDENINLVNIVKMTGMEKSKAHILDAHIKEQGIYGTLKLTRI